MVQSSRQPAAMQAAADPWRGVRWGLASLGGVLVVGTAGYLWQGMGLLDAVYQTVTTISTVGFREVEPLDSDGKVFTIGLILVGVGATLYTFSLVLETLVEGRLTHLFWRRRMERSIADMTDHVIVCGWGRVGRATAHAVSLHPTDLVVLERDAERVATVPFPVVHGDATVDQILEQAGVARARVVVAALNTDADNLYVTITARSLAPDTFIVARARSEHAERRLLQAGADRVVNPQRIGGDRMAAFALQPHVAEFLDVVMHDANLEFRLEEVVVGQGSTLADRTLRDSAIRDLTGAMVLAMRDGEGRFNTNPPPDTMVHPGHVLIAIGQPQQLAALGEAAGSPSRSGVHDEPVDPGRLPS